MFLYLCCLSIIAYYLIVTKDRYDGYDYDPIEEMVNEPWKRVDRASRWEPVSNETFTKWQPSFIYPNYIKEEVKKEFKDVNVGSKNNRHEAVPTSSEVVAPGIKREQLTFTPDDADIMVMDDDENAIIASMIHYAAEMEKQERFAYHYNEQA